ncbi:hypothetical protein ACLK1V_22710 [Escherichia coli]
MMELYMAYADYHDLIELTSPCSAPWHKRFWVLTKVTYGEHVFDFGKPFEKLTMREAIKNIVQKPIWPTWIILMLLKH